MQQIRQDLIDVAFPFWQIGNGQDGIDSVVPSAVDGLNVKTIQLKNAENVSVLNDALGQTPCPTYNLFSRRAGGG